MHVLPKSRDEAVEHEDSTAPFLNEVVHEVTSEEAGTADDTDILIAHIVKHGVLLMDCGYVN